MAFFLIRIHSFIFFILLCAHCFSYLLDQLRVYVHLVEIFFKIRKVFWVLQLSGHDLQEVYLVLNQVNFFISQLEKNERNFEVNYDPLSHHSTHYEYFKLFILNLCENHQEPGQKNHIQVYIILLDEIKHFGLCLF